VTSPATASAFRRQPLEAFLDRLGSREPVPASGSTAALVGAMAAALVEKVARITDEWDGSRGAAAQARTLRKRLLGLAPADADAYRAALTAMREPAGVRPEDRDAAIGRSLERAADVPLAIADAAADAAELAAEAAERCKPAVRSDAVAAADLAAGATRAAAQLVGVNLATAPGDPRTTLAAEITARAAAARERIGAGG
jgi:formiminotetrahydrofolate cyclodeaminase